jgi:hypothetical protein
MSDHYERHAEEVAKAFMDLLDDEVRARISDDHRNELAMLVEAAISTAVLGEMERAADKVAELSNSLRHHAEHYDKTG